MEFETRERGHPNIRSYSADDYKFAKAFAEKMQKELQGGFLKAAVLFGSTARKERTFHEPDIDVLLIINDLTMILSPEVVEAYRVITANTASKVCKRLHITTFKLTSFWDYLRNGDPIAVNMLRDGVPLTTRDSSSQHKRCCSREESGPQKKAYGHISQERQTH